MDSSGRISIDDTSPCISYSPFRDTFTTPNLSAGWNPYYDQSGFATSSGETGNGTSLHITSLNGASLALQWRGTAVELWGNATSANYSITLDGQPISPGPLVDNMLAKLENLTDASHTVVLTAQIPGSQNPPNSSMLVFDKAIVTSSPIPASSHLTFKPQTLEDNEIAFLGRWSFETTPSNLSFHTSHSAGDRALATFNGSAFVMSGKTSPQAGNFTVTLDNVTTTMTGRSSFTTFGSLLFLSTGLDPLINHTVEVRNVDGGELSLSVGGFQTFSFYNSTPPNNTSATPSPASATIVAIPKGTVAAFALAGILAFIAFSAFLYFFLIWRPRSRRRRAAGNGYKFRRQSPKEQEGGMVLDIGPEVPSKDVGHYEDDDDWDEYEGEPEVAALEDRRVSGRSSFSRWKKQAAAGHLGGMSLGINYRHSDSAVGVKDKSSTGAPREERHISEPSSVPSSDSSTRRKERAKRKGKARQLMGRSGSSTYTLDLPWQTQSTSAAQRPLSRVTSGGLSSFYAAEPSSPIPPRSAIDPPSYAASVSASRSNLSSLVPSGPRSVSQSPENTTYPLVHHRDSTRGFLLHQGEPSSDQESPQDELPLTIQIDPPAGSLNEGGSLSVEDNPSLAEPASLRKVIRSLSPRTVVSPRLTQSYSHQPSILRQQQDAPRSPESEASLDSPTRELLLQPESISLNDPPPPPSKKPTPPPIKVIRPLPRPPVNDDEDLVEIKDGVFLSVRETSPFQVNFDPRSTQIPTNIAEESATKPASYSIAKESSKGSSGDGSKVVFAGDLPTAKGKSKARDKAKKRKPQPEFVEGASSKPFRLTPMTFPSAPAGDNNTTSGSSDGVTSFLDFTSSREPSLHHSRSVKTTASASDLERNVSIAYQSIQGSEPKSRWSNVTASTNPVSVGAGSASGGTNESSSGKSKGDIAAVASRSTASSTFPIAVRVTVPPSPHHIMDDPSPTHPHRRSALSGMSDSQLHTHPHLETIDSPTDSIPMSVSDLHFRHSDSEDGPNSRRVTGSSLAGHALQGGHPPLPESLSTDDRIRPFDPSILVSRVLGLPSPTRFPTVYEGQSRSASAAGGTSLSPSGTPRLHSDYSAEQLGLDMDRSRTDLHS